MKVQIQFEIDLQQLYDNNKTSYILRDMSFEDMVDELRQIFGSNLEGISNDAMLQYTHNFIDVFNY